MHTKPSGFGRFGIGLVGLVKGLTHNTSINKYAESSWNYILRALNLNVKVFFQNASKIFAQG